MKLEERFLNYVSYWTTSDENGTVNPTSEREFASIFKDAWIDLIWLFFLKCGFDSKLLIAVIRPIFSEIEET